MDFKDLMVGDLVYVVRGYDKHLTIEKIKGVIEDEDKPYPVTMFTGETVSLNDIKPIPLTEDILEKNGFMKGSDDDVVTFKHGNFFLFYYPDGTGLYSYNTQIIIRYVHTLQHLLRLCGIEKELTI